VMRAARDGLFHDIIDLRSAGDRERLRALAAAGDR
jgi:hypothetical protein